MEQPPPAPGSPFPPCSTEQSGTGWFLGWFPAPQRPPRGSDTGVGQKGGTGALAAPVGFCWNQCRTPHPTPRPASVKLGMEGKIPFLQVIGSFGGERGIGSFPWARAAVILTCLKPCESLVLAVNALTRDVSSLAWGLDGGRWRLLPLMSQTLPSDPAGNGEGSTSGAVKHLMAGLEMGLERLAVAGIRMLSGGASAEICLISQNW